MSVFFTLVLILLGAAAPIFAGDTAVGRAESLTVQRSYSPTPPPPSGNAPAVTRWMDPLNRPPLKHNVQTINEPLRMERAGPSPLKSAVKGLDDPAPSPGRICLLVHREVDDRIPEDLDRYEADLAAMGFTVTRNVYESGRPEDLRTMLQGLYAEPESLVGAIFVGEIPHVVFEMYDKFGQADPENWTYTDFPCDLFFMDLDGQWLDTLDDGDVRAGNEKFDTWEGSQDLEIWVCRLKPANLGDLNTENLLSADFQADLLSSYFQKNHGYRVGTRIPSPTVLVYDDDDWQDFGRHGGEDENALGLVFDPVNVRSEWDPEITTTPDYKDNRLPVAPQLILLRSHGFSGGHGFFYNGRTEFDYVYPNDYSALDAGTPFFSLYVCSGSDFTAENYLAGTVALNPGGLGLLAWGSTKTGGMWNDAPFYQELARGQVFGEAFRLWFNKMSRDYVHTPQLVREWWYGMVLTGDAALKPLTTASPTGSLTVSLFPAEAGGMWKVDGGDWQNSGDTVAGLSVLGEHTIHFKDAPGWVTPRKQGVTVSPGLVRTLSGIYSSTRGSLTVTITPREAVTAGAQWSVNGGDTWNDSGALVDLAAGGHTVTFKTIPGWVTPASRSLNIGSGMAFRIEEAYTPLLGADFTSSSPTGKAPLKVTFTGNSIGTVTPAKWLWDFGDGGTSTKQNPVYIYRKAGSYTVTLTVTAPGLPPSTRVYADYVNVYTAPRSYFTATSTRGKIPPLVSFSDKSTGSVTNWAWDFGDGGSSSEQSPAHTYAKPGSYTVWLTVSGPGGIHTTSRRITALK